MKLSWWLKPGLTSADVTEEAGLAFLSLLLIATVFYADAFTNIQSAIAVLHAIALLLAAPFLSKQGIVSLAIFCGILSIAAFVLGHVDALDAASALRLAVSLAALTITGGLILRNETSHQKLVSANAVISASEARYRSIFEQSRIALWERDYSATRDFILSLRQQGVQDFRSYAAATPWVLEKAVSLIRTVAANDSARELMGLQKDSPLPTSLFPHLSTGSDTVLDLLDCIFHGDTRFEQKLTITARDGISRDVLLTLCFPDDACAFDRVTVAMIDITHRERMQKTLREAQAELANASRAATIGAMSASLAHELNQPLGANVVNAETLIRWLEKDPPDLAAIRRSAERIVRDSQRASEIIVNTRNLIKRDKREFEVISLRELVEETRALLDDDLQRESIVVLTDEEFDLPKVSAVRIELQQVLINLLSNGIQAIRGASSVNRLIYISLARKSDEAVSLKVRDSGPGIPEDVMRKLFTPFFTTKDSGMGMGLSICRSTMEAIGGSLSASNHESTGAVFEMIIPMEAAQ